MFISVAPLSTPRQPLIALCAVLLLAATAARADEIQDASKLLKAGQHQQALEQVNKILAAKAQYEKARAALEQSIRTHPSYATAYENLGDVYAKLASQAYDKALQLDSSNSTTQNKLALIRDLITTSGKGNVKP